MFKPNHDPSIQNAWPKDKPYIVLEHIIKTFKTTAGETPVLKDINIEVLKGEFVSVVGRSGSGKSTLANMITGIDHPTSGTIRVGNTVLNGMAESPMSIWRGKNLGIVFQFFQLLPMLSLVENVMLPMDFSNYHDPADREKEALALLEKVGLSEHAFLQPSAISGGQQQSTAIARALANDPPIIIADEPTGNLDSKTAESVMQLFEELAGQGKTILMVTHDNSLANRTNRKLVIADGELINESISHAFPELDHTNLLDLSHLAKPVQFKPDQAGEILPRDPYVLQITSGSLKATDSTMDLPGDPAMLNRQFMVGPTSSEIQFLPDPNGIVHGLIYPKEPFFQLTEMTMDQVGASSKSNRPFFARFFGQVGRGIA